MVDTRSGTPVGQRHRLDDHAPAPAQPDRAGRRQRARHRRPEDQRRRRARRPRQRRPTPPSAGTRPPAPGPSSRAAAVARQYHSIALLLPDGRVLTGGGGICGACQQVGYLRRDFEIFTPPYLYLKDGSGQLAPRPEITGAPTTLGYDGAFTSPPQAASIRKLALVRLGAPTHSEDQSQRYVPLSFTVVRHDADRRRPEQPERGARRPLHALRRSTPPACRRWPRSSSSSARSSAAPPHAVNLALNKAATGSTACVSSRGSGQGRQRLGLRRATRQVLHQGRAAPASCTVDLGSSQPVNRFVIQHAGAGGESTSMNTRAYRIETRTTLDGLVEHRGHGHRQHREHHDEHDHGRAMPATSGS